MSMNVTIARSSLLVLFICAGLLAGCEHKMDIDEFRGGTVQAPTIGDTSYVEVFPPWGGFEKPVAVMIGNDQLLYVADYDNNEIVMLDAGGSVLKRRGIPHPQAIAQNSKLDLYVAGETIAPNGVDTIGALYRIALVRWDTMYLAGIRIDTLRHDTTNVYRDTSYFANHNLDTAHMRLVWQEPGRPARRFPGIGILPDNGYLLARTGPDNSSSVDPDTRVLLFTQGDTLVTPLGDLITRPTGGTGITDIRNLTGIMVFPGSRDFLLTQSNEQVAYGAIWMIYQSTADFQGWLPKFDPTNPVQRGVDFVRQNRFLAASGATYDRRRRELFIVDAGLDSVVKFDRNGLFKAESFGKSVSASAEFPALSGPRGVAFSNDCTLYIADTGNKVIRRFKLSTQTQCN
jgi:hypothetical protein